MHYSLSTALTMTCCQCQGIEQEFNPKLANRDLRRYRKKGPSKTTRWLLKALAEIGFQSKTLLDIGGGVGAIQHRFMAEGGAHVYNVDASSAYLDAAQQEATRLGYAAQATYHHGDFLACPLPVETTDFVTLDRVICCYHDMPGLVKASMEKARTVYGVVYPRDTWWLRGGVVLANWVLRLRRSSFRAFVHPTEGVEKILREGGFQRRFHRQTLIWQVAVFTR